MGQVLSFDEITFKKVGREADGSKTAMASSGFMIQNRTNKRDRKDFLLAFLMAITFLIRLPTDAAAGLDGNRTQVQEDAQKLGLVSVSTSAKNGYTTVTLALPPGSPLSQNGLKTLTVREFLDAAGQVFAVAWEGSLLPDLSVLLGRHFSSLPAQNQSPDRHHLFTHTPNMEIRVIGTARFRAGKAWIPSRLPPGFTPDQIGVRTP